jgi:hypothetical protein
VTARLSGEVGRRPPLTPSALLHVAVCVATLFLIAFAYLPLGRAPGGLAPALPALALHGATALAVYALSREAGLGILASASALLLFALHPSHVEMLASAPLRPALPATLFSILALAATARHAPQPPGTARARWAAAATCVASASSQVLSPAAWGLLPAIALQHRLLQLGAVDGSRLAEAARPRRVLTPALVGTLGAAAVWVFWRDPAPLSPEPVTDFLGRLAVSFSQLAFPTGLAPGAESGVDVGAPLAAFRPLAGATILLGGGALVFLPLFRTARRGSAPGQAVFPSPRTGWATGLTLVPFLAASLLPPSPDPAGVAASSYAAAAGFCLLLGLLLGRLADGYPAFPEWSEGQRYRTVGVMLTVLLGAFTLLTWVRTSDRALRETRIGVGSPAEISSPARDGSAQPRLGAAAGAPLLSWLEPEGDGMALRYSRLESSGWTWPGTAARGTGFFVNWADVPSVLEAKDGTLYAHWLVRSGEAPYAYDILLSSLEPGADAWSMPVSPHEDGVEAEHGFVSLIPEEDARIGVVWLDGRETEGAHGEHHGGGRGATQLRYRSWHPRQPGPEFVLDPRVCDCCDTAAALSASGLIVAYRDRSDDEVRDISLVRRIDGSWTEPIRLHDDGWTIPGCPVNGPALAAEDLRVAVAWFTAPRGSGRVQVVFSQDGGASFTAPIRADEGNPIGRVDISLLPDGSALVLWMERTPHGGEILLRKVLPAGTTGPAVRVARPGSGRAAGFPRLLVHGEGAVVAWTDPGPPSRVRLATLPLFP